MTAAVVEKARPAVDDLPARAAAARERLDAWVRECVAWHFDPATGTPFWLDYAAKLGLDPRREIHCFDDLAKLGPFQDEWLRGGPVRRWVPKAYSDRPVYVFETGGSTGIPKSRINIEDFRIDYSMFSDTLNETFFLLPARELAPCSLRAPSGPRRLRLAVEHLAQVRGGICFCIDLDPRWVIRLIKQGQFAVLEDYKDHCIQQALTILRANHEIKCMFTTPKLLEALCEKISLKKAGITGIFCGGTEMTRQFHRFAREELIEGADFVPTYGNTLMGLACNKPFDPADDYSIIYHAPQPRAVLQVVQPDNPAELVEYGQWGRVRLTTLTKEFFVPGFLERDEALRTPPVPAYPWDGVADVRPFKKLDVNVVEGVY